MTWVREPKAENRQLMRENARLQRLADETRRELHDAGQMGSACCMLQITGSIASAPNQVTSSGVATKRR